MSKKTKLIITKEDIYKAIRKALREEIGFQPPKVHKTHKKDKKRKNTVRRDEIGENS